MQNITINREFGRSAFGSDPAAYHAARPSYPDWVFEMLVERGCLAGGTRTFEIGAGTGIATRRLLELGADPLVVIESDNRMAQYLAASMPEAALEIYTVPFEEAELPEGVFDFGFSATAFHWLDEPVALQKIARLLKPGGWWGMVWNVYGNHERENLFHHATKHLLEGALSPSQGAANLPYALDFKARLAALEETNAFENIEYRAGEWPLVLTAEQTVALYATYSPISIRPDRDELLAELGRIAREQFKDRVIRDIVTCLYIARKKCY
ncbi:bifunctional 2-polyprenyl-6-hydroxyphenol methylase/3-demethylubiquinol 3-O-methyltransferase UbiG [Mucilaginibacter sp. L3T2-6]|uniref:class I SAM-dependent methyltransferase n=1 Tax=Mucilaginibacter sp. L3T2-6 TaxID=3062491 RepID=UPI0026771BC8|nr:class I SAM-dependent methyltransferase [Mucilaginibacter sp. L3T2-6]MDO3641632.1 class I SAM-dependent methyltransferase [Mucilaginibacter sp. L3T2-6]MDV6214126.1 class I SAM-dependent methyltransferase [Mucilaginibacter sp. L3T2-6]